MEIREFLDRIADFCGRKNWADFSPSEDRLLVNIFEEIDQDAYNRALEENQCYDESDIEDAREEGRVDGYDDGQVEGYDEGFAKGVELGFEHGYASCENKVVHNEDVRCNNIGVFVNQGVHWCEKQCDLYPDFCKYCKDYEAFDYGTTTSTQN